MATRATEAAAGEVPFVLLIVEAATYMDTQVGSASPAMVARLARITRVARVMRLFRVLRFLRVERMQAILRKLQMMFIFSGRYSTAVVGILQVMTMFAFVMHVASCIFAWVCTDFDGQIRQEAGPYSEDGHVFTLWEKYSFAFFWSVNTLSGGSPPTAPTSGAELWFWTVVAMCYITVHKLSPFLKGRVLSAIRTAHAHERQEGSFVDAIEPLLSEDLRRKVKGAIYNTMLEKFPPFRGMPCSVLSKLAFEGTYGSYVANDYIFREGEPSESMVVVTAGRAAISSSSKRAFLPCVGAGWWLDEAAILGAQGEDGPTRPYSCVAMGPCTTLEICREDFEEARTYLRGARGGAGPEPTTWCPVCTENHEVWDCDVLLADDPDEDDKQGRHHVQPVSALQEIGKSSRQRFVCQGKSLPKEKLARAQSVPQDDKAALAQIAANMSVMMREVMSFSGRLSTLEERTEAGLGDLAARVSTLQTDLREVRTQLPPGSLCRDTSGA